MKKYILIAGVNGAGKSTLSEKDSNAYKLMKTRYHDLKAILTSSGINLVDIDRVKE